MKIFGITFGLGNLVALYISVYKTNSDLFMHIIHTLFGWFYVVYYFLFT